MAKTTKKLTDFGEKIGGARKDLWAGRGLSTCDLEEMNEAEKRKFVVKDNIWPLPDAKKLVEEGLPAIVAYWQREIRKTVLKAPYVFLDEELKLYIEAVELLRDTVMACREYPNDVYAFYNKLQKNEFAERIDPCVQSIWALQRTQYNIAHMGALVKRNNFPYGKKKSQSSKPAKKRFVPPQLEHVERIGGIDLRHGKNVDADMWQKSFHFRGVEYGNWLSQNDRQFSTNYCYDAFFDLAKIIDISIEDISFQGELALAFGARGRSGALAHYEPLRKVINLTKMKGAGCTAHEWFHALDHHLGLLCGASELLSESVYVNGKTYELCQNPEAAEAMAHLIKQMKMNPAGGYSEYYKNSVSFGAMFSKEPHGYWGSNCEMLARAFACFVEDEMKEAGMRNDYLSGHADSYVSVYNGKKYLAYPEGLDRIRINLAFKRLVDTLKELDVFHAWQEPEPVQSFLQIRRENDAVYADFEFSMESDGQLALF